MSGRERAASQWPESRGRAGVIASMAPSDLLEDLQMRVAGIR